MAIEPPIVDRSLSVSRSIKSPSGNSTDRTHEPSNSPPPHRAKRRSNESDASRPYRLHALQAEQQVHAISERVAHFQQTGTRTRSSTLPVCPDVSIHLSNTGGNSQHELG